ncbi:MAG: c-type cytochrome, partial [Gemmatales bacterium]|nr:c-type cytochrome [Gemmatales bacterium]MDW8386717.1 c-type cytochrome [Gemmatales bacterium]
NKGYPLGLKEARGLLGVGITTDCMICHGGSIFGQSYIGLGNASLDLQSLYEDLAQAMGRKQATPFPFTNVRGTTEAGAMAVFLFQLRDADLKLRPAVDLGMRTDLCEDAPAWWLLKKKQTMYHTGSTNARSVRSIMQFMLTPLNSAEDVKKQEPAFADIQAFILSLEPPEYPLPIDRDQASRGEKLFAKHCASCHGTYGDKPTYPNKIIDLDVIGTDPTRAEGFTLAAKQHYDNSWFGQELDAEGRRMVTLAHRGYQAPPLDGVWATAPYLHNGSVPTLYHLLNSTSRPKVFTRSYRTGLEDYDAKLVGWKVEVLDAPLPESASPSQRRRVYDTTKPGRGNQGHTFGDKLTEEERFSLIEYLKTL